VKGGSRALLTRRRPIEAALKATDFEGLDLLPADFSYRNMDLKLDDTTKRTRRLGQRANTPVSHTRSCRRS
jgi:chromosome partitioning protein